MVPKSILQVALELDSEHLPEELLCHVHPIFRMIRDVVKTYVSIETQIGREKRYSVLMVNATTSHDAILEQYLDVAMKLISRDYDHKPWNYSNLFEKHIHPWKNYAVGFKTHRFERFVDTCAYAVHHHDDLESFLDKYENVTNTLACIIRYIPLSL